MGNLEVACFRVCLMQSASCGDCATLHMGDTGSPVAAKESMSSHETATFTEHEQPAAQAYNVLRLGPLHGFALPVQWQLDAAAAAQAQASAGPYWRASGIAPRGTSELSGPTPVGYEGPNFIDQDSECSCT